tara:strand:- start:245 stop:814 length:570 start_codon:yes stop_codon:yes gene_type:complete
MTSRLIVNSIRHTGASADAITLDNSGNATFPANVTCSGTASGFGGGKVKQVKYSEKVSGALSTTSTSFQAVSDLDLSITPTSASSIILMQLNIRVSGAHASGSDASMTVGVSTDSGSSYLTQQDMYPYRWDTGGIYLRYPHTMFHAAVAGSTSVKNFKVYYKRTGATIAHINEGGSTDKSYLLLWEIEA